MSESSADEFASYDPTTPAKTAVPAKRATARTTRAGSRSAAGSSSKASSVVTKKKKNAKPDQEQIVIDSSSGNESDNPAAGDDIIVTVSPPPKVTTKKGPPGANGRIKPSAGKGKGKAEPGASKPDPTTKRSENVMEVDDAGELEGDIEGPPAKRSTHARTQNQTSKANPTVSHQTKEHEGLLRDLETLRRQMDNVTSERDKYSKQLEELFQIRHTEPEQALEQQSAQYEARLKTQESMINELTTQLTKIKALGGSEKSYTLHFLTREAADEEKEAVEREVGRWKDVVKQKDAQLAEKDKRIAEFEAEAKVLRSDLAAEIERGRILASRNPPPSITRANAKPAEDPKNGRVIRLYEDMTNLLVVSAKIERSSMLNLDEAVFACVYTHRESTTDTKGPSLNFSLRELYEKPENFDANRPITEKDLLPKVKYQPRDLQNEPEDFVQGLDFFKDAFIFARDQMPVFLKTLTERMANVGQPTDDEAEEDQLDEDIQIVE